MWSRKRHWVLGLLLASLGGIVLAAGKPEVGKKVYKDRRCAMCHRIDGSGGKMGGPLDEIGSKHETARLRDFIQDPKSVDPVSKMKAVPDLTQAQMDDLVAYLLTLKTPPTPK